MLKLVFCTIFLATSCCAQEHMNTYWGACTCLKTDDALTQQSPQTPQTTVQGPPGKRGAKGQVGSSGSKGQKGEPGIFDNPRMKLIRDKLNFLSQDVEALKTQSTENQLQEKLKSLSQEVEALKNQSQKNRLREQLDFLTQEVEALKNQIKNNQENATVKNGLLVNSHLYIYKLTSSRQSWQGSRQFCQNWGGDLAVHGVKSLENRRKLFQSLSINYHYWIGASDIASEGNWMWLNGEPAKSSELHWETGQPTNGTNSNCAVLVGEPGRSDINRAYGDPCASLYLGLCEKAI